MHGTHIQSCERADSAHDGVLAGLVIDAAGQAMVPSRGSAAGRSMYYATVSPTAAVPTKIPAARLDRNVISVLKRVGLLRGDWLPGDLATVVRCVVVTPSALELQLSARACLALWRAPGRVTVGRVLREMTAALAPGEVIHEVGTALHLNVPRFSRNRCVYRRAQTQSGLSGSDASSDN